MKIENLIVGAGFAGAALARMIAEEKAEKVLVIDKRNHIGGNAYDFYNHDGILVHKYGPHIFHTNNKLVWDYLSRFTDWNYYQHKVLALVDGKETPFPINLDTINLLYGTNYNSATIEDFLVRVKIEKDCILNAEDMVVSKIGIELYEKLFKGYTKKQWGVYPSELAPEVTARIPIRKNRDDRYFTDQYQGVPKYGYTELFAAMLNHKNIQLMLNTDFSSLKDQVEYNQLYYSGCIDEFFDYKYGKLAYRSLDFEMQTLNTEYYQKVGTINYPMDYDFTRITEFKHLTGQKHEKTTIVREYPKSTGEPFYPVPREESKELYKVYENAALECKNVFFIGRLGKYQYLNMDKAVESILELGKSK